MAEVFQTQRMREALRRGRFEWRKHALQRLAERNILQIEVLKGLRTGKIIEEYPEDTPHPTALFLCMTETRPLHIVAAYDEANHWAYLITVYEPDLESFEPDFTKRRKK